MAAVSLAGFLTAISSASGQSVLPESMERVLHYERSDDLADPVARLQKQVAAGSLHLTFSTNQGYLSSVLRALDVPKSSQTLVFSKTSSQRAHTSPQTPRAVYFSDQASVGWTPGSGEIDIASVDPQRGPIFYTLTQDRAAAPSFVRHDDCLQCHLGPKTLNVPGLLVRSYHTASNGVPLRAVPEFINGHNSPISARWGGWYVTGKSADLHLGNLLSGTGGKEDAALGSSLSLFELRGRFDSSRYLSGGSDIVALLVLEHQLRMQNLLTRANYETRLALDDQKTAAASAEWPKERIAQAAEMLLEYMLLRSEAPLKGPVLGSSAFQSDFQRAGPRDRQGRSLRELDLKTRLFRYPCSFLVYSPSFDGLPPVMKEVLWSRLRQILAGEDRTATYVNMSADDRRNVLQILRDTKPEFAAWLNSNRDLASR